VCHLGAEVAEGVLAAAVEAAELAVELGDGAAAEAAGVLGALGALAGVGRGRRGGGGGGGGGGWDAWGGRGGAVLRAARLGADGLGSQLLLVKEVEEVTAGLELLREVSDAGVVARRPGWVTSERLQLLLVQEVEEVSTGLELLREVSDARVVGGCPA
jgi:hypothetical protein